MVNEYFDKAKNDYFNISENKMKVKNIKEDIAKFDHTIYCKQRIKISLNIIAKWTFYIEKIGCNKMIFGL